MLLTIQHHQPIKSSSLLLTLALSTASLGITAMSPAFADSHTAAHSAPSALDYESALTSYKSLDDGEPSTWKQSNDTVGQIGGWRSYANEAYEANQADANAKSDAQYLADDSSKMQESVKEDSKTQLDVRSNTRPLTMEHQSAMTSYRHYDDNPPGDWKAANDRVGQIGGWRTYAQEAYEASKREAQAMADGGNLQ